MVRPVKRQHVSPIVPLIIARVRTSPVVQVHEHFPVLCADGKAFPSRRQIEICIFPVHCRDSRHIFRSFHTSFDLERIDPGLHKLRDQLQRTDILQAQVMPFLSVSRIWQPAGLGTLPPVTAPPAQDTAQKTLSRVAVAQSPVDKTLHLKVCSVMDPPYLLQRELPCRHHAPRTSILKETGSFHICDRHLGARVEIHLREPCPDSVKHTDILDNDSIQAFLIERRQILIQTVHLFILQKRIHSEIKPAPVKMRFPDCLPQLFFRKIIRIGAGAESGASRIHSVRSRAHCRPEAVIGACRRKYFNLSAYFSVANITCHFSSFTHCLFFSEILC